MQNIQILCNKILELLSEIESYRAQKKNFIINLKDLFKKYQAGQYTYFEYEKIQKKALKEKTKQEWLDYYDSYIQSLLKQLDTYNSQIFYETYHDNEFKKLIVIAQAKAPETQVKEKIILKKEIKKKIEPIKQSQKPTKLPEPEDEKELIFDSPELIGEDKHLLITQKTVPKVNLVDLKPSFIERISIFIKGIFARREIRSNIKKVKESAKQDKKNTKPKILAKRIVEDITKTKENKPKADLFKKSGTDDHFVTPSLFTILKNKLFHKKNKDDDKEILNLKKKSKLLKKKASWYTQIFKKKEIPKAIKSDKKETDSSETVGTVTVGHIFSWDNLRKIFASDDTNYLGKKTKISNSTLQMETLRRRNRPELKTQIEKITKTALTEEAKRIQDILERRKSVKIYEPSFFGAFANITIKRVSLYLLKNFPDFFKELYRSLRLANIKVLSNTYVNMMVLGMFVSFFFGLFFFGMFFLLSNAPLIQLFMKTIMMSVILALITFAGFYGYPSSVSKKRRRSINTNLPFAINHMAAVASSDVSPTRMFKLISESPEYGEIAVEIKKIINYIDIFGYDVLTAIKTVAATTPSPMFKEFFEGMLATTQSGGDIKSFLRQKSDETMVNYKLERQKYTETISTYSDIYTGILIAAPLFFVATLSLVSLLGGTVGSLDVNVVIVVGTYVVIPLLNIGFMSFLEVTQPEV